jgi:hydrogenase maturation protease
MPGASTADAGLPRTLVVGLGNPILGDDGVGWKVADAVEAALDRDGGSARARGPVVVERLAVGGLALMERLAGERHAIIVDAVLTGADPPGTVRVVGVAALPGREASHLDSAHDVTFATAMAIGRSLGADLPDDVTIITIEAVRVGDFGEAMTPAVEAALPEAVARVLGLLGR